MQRVGGRTTNCVLPFLMALGPALQQQGWVQSDASHEEQR